MVKINRDLAAKLLHCIPVFTSFFLPKPTPKNIGYKILVHQQHKVFTSWLHMLILELYSTRTMWVPLDEIEKCSIHERVTTYSPCRPACSIDIVPMLDSTNIPT
jgi:hypothetical protein